MWRVLALALATMLGPATDALASHLPGTCVTLVGDLSACLDTGHENVYAIRNAGGTGGGFLIDINASALRPLNPNTMHLLDFSWIRGRDIDLYSQLYFEQGLCELAFEMCSMIVFGPATHGHPNVQVGHWLKLQFIDAGRPVREYMALDALVPSAPSLDLGRDVPVRLLTPPLPPAGVLRPVCRDALGTLGDCP